MDFCGKGSDGCFLVSGSWGYTVSHCEIAGCRHFVHQKEFVENVDGSTVLEKITTGIGVIIGYQQFLKRADKLVLQEYTGFQVTNRGFMSFLTCRISLLPPAGRLW